MDPMAFIGTRESATRQPCSRRGSVMKAWIADCWGLKYEVYDAGEGR